MTTQGQALKEIFKEIEEARPSATIQVFSAGLTASGAVLLDFGAAGSLRLQFHEHALKSLGHMIEARFSQDHSSRTDRAE